MFQNDGIVTDDVETSKDSMQVYIVPCPLETESEKAKECERTMFGICKDKYTNLKAKGLSF